MSSSRPRIDKQDPAPGSAPIGLAIFLVSLGVLFAGSLVAYFAVRATSKAWASPPLPVTVWISTALLLLSSATLHAALVGARQDRQERVRGGMAATTALGLGFLGSQVVAWVSLAQAGVTASGTLEGWTFYMLTALHGLHVVGGLVPLAFTTAQAFRGRYGPDRATPILLCAMYWHFLDGVWLVIVGVLALT